MVRFAQSRLSAFARNVRGNVALTFALGAGVLATAVGGGLDYSRSAGIGTELQSALDSGVLAAASLTQDRSPEEVVRAYVEAAIGDHAGVLETLNLEVTSDVALNSRRIGARASVQVPTTLLGITGVNDITVVRQTEAVERARNIEVSLVLDISSSMRGNKIDNLREASLDFVDTVLDADVSESTSISVVPYGGTVRLPDSFFRFITDADEYAPSGFDWRIPVPDVAADWNGCIELTGDEVDSMALTLGGHGVVPNFTVWHASNGWCPDEEGTEAVFLTNDRDALHDLLETFDNPILSDGTGTDIGAGWGMRALHPGWRGELGGHSDYADRPAAFDDEETMKVLVVMTDGGITQQRRPDNAWDPDGDYDSLSHVGTGGTNNLYNKGKARDNFDDICTYAKNNGVVVYTIAFQVGGGRNRRDMEDCASSPARYYDVQDLNIAAAFSAIAADLNQLRLSR